MFVNINSTYTHLDQLYRSSAIFAYNDECSLSGFHCLRFFLYHYVSKNFKNTDTLFPFFSKIIKTGSHFNSVQAVLNGNADVLVLDCTVRENMLSTKEGRDILQKLRPIDIPTLPAFSHTDSNKSFLLSYNGLLGPNPVQPVVASNRLSSHLINRICEAFTTISAEALAPVLADRYEAVHPHFYDHIDAMMSICKETDILCENELEFRQIDENSPKS